MSKFFIKMLMGFIIGLFLSIMIGAVIISIILL